MMMRSDHVRQLLQAAFPSVPCFNGAIDRNLEYAVGVFSRRSSNRVVAVGGRGNSSYNILPVTILAHWSQDADQCEQTAQSIFDYLYCKSNFSIGDVNVIVADVLSSGPIDIDRDENNICEMTINVDFFYER